MTPFHLLWQGDFYQKRNVTDVTFHVTNVTGGPVVFSTRHHFV